MRRSIAALALIRRQDEHGRTCWLAQWNRKWNVCAFVGGHKRPEESFRECVIREVEEELGLQYGPDFQVAAEPLADLEYTTWSHSAGEETAYTIELFEVELTDTARQKVESAPINRWLTEEEIRNQRCSDGQAVSETVPLILGKMELFPTSNKDA